MFHVSEVLYAKLSFEKNGEAYDTRGLDSFFELSRFRPSRKDVGRCQLCDFQNEYGSPKDVVAGAGNPSVKISY
jgi:hypothetical protein